MRRAARVDDNHQAVVALLRSMGCTVQSLAAVGNGVPDLLVGCSGRNYLLEVKDGSKPPSRQKMTADQLRWHNLWKGQVSIVYSVEMAEAWVNARRRER